MKHFAFRLLLLFFATLTVLPAVSPLVRACEMCNLTGSTAFHTHSANGDSDDDALFVPSNHDGPSSNYVALSGWPQPGGKGTPLTLTYSYQNMFPNEGGILMPNEQKMPHVQIRDAIESALALWASVTPLSFQEVEDDGITNSPNAGRIRFRQRRINGPDPVIGDPTTKARAWFPSNGDPIGGDVEFDNEDRWQQNGTLSQPDILGAALHEIGHAIGLNHSLEENPNEFYTWKRYNSQGQPFDYTTPKGNSVMFWIFERFQGPGTEFLFQDDIDGIRSIYGWNGTPGRVIPLIGTWQDRPLPPTSGSPAQVEFADVPTRKWFDTTLAGNVQFTALDGTLFTEITELPTGYAEPFKISVNGTVVGEFSGGQRVDFQSFSDDGVAEFTISRIVPLTGAGDSNGFPLRLGFASALGSFASSAVVPEPAAMTLLLIAGASWFCSRARRR